MATMAQNPFVGKVTGSIPSGLADPAEVRQALGILADPAHCVELRGLPSGKSKVRPGNDLDALVEAAETLSGNRGLYYTLNPTSLLAGVDRAAKVADVVKRRWLLVDIDPTRPPDTNATEQEKEAAKAVADRVAVHLGTAGWPQPVVIDSGNGWHLLYRIDEPADQATQTLLRGVLARLADQHDTQEAHVDRAVHNASRIAKLPGSWSRKGPHSKERPHRPARLWFVPPTLGVVTRQQLQQVASGEQQEAPRPGPARIYANPFIGKVEGPEDKQASYARAALAKEVEAVRSAPSGERNNTLNKAAFSLGQIISAGILTRSEVVEALSAAAASNGLAEQEILRTIESGLAKGMEQPRALPEGTGKTVKEKDREARAKGASTRIWTLKEVMATHFPPPRWSVPGILSEGLSILAGKPKLGKSFLSLNLAITIAAGGKALGAIQCEQGQVLYLSLEDRLRRVQDRARKVLAGLGEEASANLHIAVECPRMSNGGLSIIEEWINAQPNPRLVIVDVWAKFRPLAKGGNVNAYDVDYEAASAIKALGDGHGLSTLILHHCKKGQQDDVVDEISGTLGLAGAADGLTILTRARSDNEATLFVTGRDVQDEELALRFNPDHCTWTSEGKADDRARVKTAQAIIEALKATTSGLFPSELASMLGKSPDTVRKELWRLCQAGQIQRKGNKYAWPGSPQDEQEERFA